MCGVWRRLDDAWCLFRMIYLALALCSGIILQNLAILRKQHAHKLRRLLLEVMLVVIYHDLTHAPDTVKPSQPASPSHCPPISHTP